MTRPSADPLIRLSIWFLPSLRWALRPPSALWA
jgi:hypothetical protein